MRRIAATATGRLCGPTQWLLHEARHLGRRNFSSAPKKHRRVSGSSSLLRTVGCQTVRENAYRIVKDGKRLKLERAGKELRYFDKTENRGCP